MNHLNGNKFVKRMKRDISMRSDALTSIKIGYATI